jgi:hypothetical protein
MLTLRVRRPNTRFVSPCRGVNRKNDVQLTFEKFLLGSARARTGNFLGGRAAVARPAFFRAGMGLARKCGVGCGGLAFTLQSADDGARSFGRRRVRGFRSLGGIAPGLSACAFRCFALLGWRQLYPSPPGLGQTDRDSLLGRASSMLAFADMLDLFADEFSGLRRWSLPLALVLLSTL